MNYNFQQNIHLLQAGLSGYSLFHAWNAISNLREWEPTTEKAAEYSETAAQELRKTRKTQASGAVTILISLTCALYTLAYPAEPETSRFWLSIAVATICAAARTYIGRFWQNKTKVPLAQKYNDAINSTLIIKTHLGLLMLAWFVTGILEAQNARTMRESLQS